MTLWPHQTRGVEEVLSAIQGGCRRILLTSPTGGGKTRMACTLIDRWLDQGLRVALYTNRRMLVDQLSTVLEKHGITHGIRAAGHDEELHLDVQISSIQTEGSRVLKKRTWQLHPAQRVLIDEAHLQKEKTAQTILEAHLAQGASYVGLTATPIGLAALYDELITAGTVSELRACGALVPCHHYGPDEPDLRHIGKVPLGEDLSEAQNVKAIMVPGIFARVFDWWKKLNPEGKSTILFAPGVAESVWFAEQFHAQGVRAAHIDGEEVWVDGEAFRSSREVRAQVLEDSRCGRIGVLCNRFVLREGIDCPWLAHGIFATVFGSLQSYLQSGGRLLRACPGLPSVTVQDHGGNWWRHGSLNADREWRLSYTAGMIAGLREERIRARHEVEPLRCPRCARVLTRFRCPCGYEIPAGKKSRPVIQADGSLKEMKGDVFKPRRISQREDAAKVWTQVYFRALKSGMTFRQAEALFAQENNWGWPPRHLPLMPADPLDWFQKVADVPRERLT